MSTGTGTASGQLAGRREWLGLAVLALPVLLLSLDLSVLYLALPHLSVDLGASSVQQLWIIDIYGFMVGGFLVTMGTLGDRIGRRRLLLIGATAFGVASMMAAFANSPEMLIATRAVLGLAGATLAPGALALVTNMFTDAKQRGVAIAAVVSCFMAGNAIGPVVGGVLLEFFWWGSAFLLGVPVMVLLLVTAPFLLPEYRDPNAGRLDLTSVALSLAAILPIIYGLKEIAKDGWRPVPTAVFVAGVAFAVAFVVRQRRLEHPLLDLRLFRHRSFSAALTIMLLGGVFLGGVTLLVTQYLQLVESLSPLQAGLWLLPSVLAMVAGAMVAPRLSQRFRPAYVIAVGLLVGAAGFVIITQVQSEGPLGVIVLGWTIALFGNGLPAGLGFTLVLSTAPPEKAGSASAIAETSTEFGIALGLATVGTIGAAVYRSRMADAVPADAPAEAAELARDNINGAFAVADQLPGVLAPARDAFATGLSVSATLSAILFVLLAGVAIAALRHVPAFGGAAPADSDGDGTPPEGGARGEHDSAGKDNGEGNEQDVQPERPLTPVQD